jgi:sec-independent protein translocase protein TatB
MFDIGFSELFVVAIVALLVLGPERLPKAARFAGLWVRRARAQWHSVKSEWESELADDELKRSLRDTREQLEQAKESLRDTERTLQSEFESVREDVRGRDGERPPPRREPEGAPPAERDPDPAGPAEREPDTDPPGIDEPGERPPERRDPAARPTAAEVPPHEADAAAAAPDAGESTREEDDQDTEWHERRRRELDMIEEEIERAMQEPEDEHAGTLEAEPRERSATSPGERAEPASHPHAPHPGDPSRDHDRR